MDRRHRREEGPALNMTNIRCLSIPSIPRRARSRGKEGLPFLALSGYSRVLPKFKMLNRQGAKHAKIGKSQGGYEVNVLRSRERGFKFF